MRTLSLLAIQIICTAMLLVAPPAHADPTAGHGTRVQVQVPPMLCQIGSDDADAGIGPNLVCQGSFPEVPIEPCPVWPGQLCPEVMHQDQAVVTAAGRFNYRGANIGVGDHPSLDTLTPGHSYNIQGWTITATDTAATFTHDTTGHGMTVTAAGNVSPF